MFDDYMPLETATVRDLIKALQKFPMEAPVLGVSPDTNKEFCINVVEELGSVVIVREAKNYAEF